METPLRQAVIQYSSIQDKQKNLSSLKGICETPEKKYTTISRFPVYHPVIHGINVKLR
jgi:hypothetical protein